MSKRTYISSLTAINNSNIVTVNDGTDLTNMSPGDDLRIDGLPGEAVKAITATQIILERPWALANKTNVKGINVPTADDFREATKLLRDATVLTSSNMSAVNSWTTKMGTVQFTDPAEPTVTYTVKTIRQLEQDAVVIIGSAAQDANRAEAARDAAIAAQNQAETHKNTAGVSAGNAATKASEAATSASTASTAATTATTKAAEAVVSASNALAEANRAEVEANKAAIAASALYGMPQAQFETTREQNKEEFAASGFVHLGKHVKWPPAAIPINEGMWSYIDAITTNKLFIGRVSESAKDGKSKNDSASINIAGVIFDLSVNTNGEWDIKFPQAPDGTVTYDSNTGKVTDYKTYLDPRYGNIAGTLSEAVKRAFEGVIKNSDFRNGVTGWGPPLSGVSVVYENGLLKCNSGSATNVAVEQTGLSFVSGVKYEVRMKGTSNQGFTVRLNGKYVEEEAQGSLVSGLEKVFLIDGVTCDNFIIAGVGEGFSLNLEYCYIRPVTLEVVTNRVDMWGFESWLEEVNTTNPYVYPNGLIQSQATTMDGVNTSASTRPVTYYAVFDGDTGSKGKGVNFFALTDVQKKKVLGNYKNNLYYLDDGRLVQWRLRQRTIAGVGNGDWEKIDSISGDSLKVNNKLNITAQGQLDYRDPFVLYDVGANSYRSSVDALNYKKNIGVYTVLFTSYGTAVNEECHFLVCGTVNRLNQGAWHPSFNPSGTRRYAVDGGHWYNTSQVIGSTSDTFAKFYLETGYIGAPSGRPDGRSYNAIYADGDGGVCRDMRYSAYGVDLVDFAEADQRVKNGTYRGFEFGRITKIISFVTSSSETASDYGRVPMTRAEALRVCELIGTPTTGATFFDQAKMAVSLYNPNNGKVIHSSAILSAQGNSNFGTYLDPENPSAIWLGFDQKVVENSLSGNQVLRIAGVVGSANSNIFCSSGQTLYAIVTTLDKVSVGGSFMQTDVIGNPVNIPAIPSLANGWKGGWCGAAPDGASKAFPRCRKALAINNRVYTTNNGASWASAGQEAVGAGNLIANGAIAFNEVSIVTYQAFAKQTEIAVNTPVYGSDAGVGSVATVRINEIQEGSLLQESLIGKVNTDTTAWVTAVNLVSNGLRTNGAFSTYAPYYPVHPNLMFESYPPANNSLAVKALDYNVNINQQAFIQYAYTELRHNGTNWGDDGKVTVVDSQATKTDLNGNTVLVGTAKLKEPIGWLKIKV